MNLNKLFKQLKIRKKLTVAFTLLATVPVFLTGLLGIKYTVGLLEENSLQQLKSSISMMQVKVDRFLNETKSDIFYLRDSFVFRQFIRSLAAGRQEDVKEWKQVVKKQFQGFAENRKIYYQLRFIDRGANEIFRIEDDGFHAVITPEQDLTKRQDIFYLYNAGDNTDRELLYTPVELKSETRSESIVPAISYFVPVYSDLDNSSLQGILIANVYARKLFEILSEEPFHDGRRTLLADNNGYYLFNSEKLEWNKLLALRKEGNLGSDFPQAVQRQILSGKEGMIDNEWNEIIAFAPIFFTGSSDNFLVLFQCISRDLIRKPIVSFMKLVLLFGSITFAVALLLGFLAANQFTKPIKALSKGSEMLAKGNLDYPIKIETNDEIEQLANDFNRMAHNLKKNEIQLKNHAEELETEVKKRTDELSKALNYLQNLFDSSIDAIITLDNERKITSFSKGAEAILGYRAEEVIGEQICSFCETCAIDRCPIVSVTGQSTTLQSHQIDFKHKQGESVPLYMSVSPIKNDRLEVVEILTISKDMTERKKMEQQIQQAEKLAGIGQLAAGLAHQLNTPLASIILSAQMLKDLIKDNEILDDIDSIERQADRCKKLIQDLLSFSRVHHKQKSKINLEEPINIAIRLMEKEFRDKDIRIRTQYDGKSKIYCNANQIEQLFFNLLQNAVDALPKGGEIRISTAKDRNQNLRITVSDTGTGIGKENLTKIFDPFFTTKDVGKGTGLGLSVCYGIVEQHHGSIAVKSQLGKGTSFTIRFPVV